MNEGFEFWRHLFAKSVRYIHIYIYARNTTVYDKAGKPPLSTVRGIYHNTMARTHGDVKKVITSLQLIHALNVIDNLGTST